MRDSLDVSKTSSFFRQVRIPHLVLALMLVSYLLRVLLLANEGQFRFPDEGMYRRATHVAELLHTGKFADSVDQLLKYDRHSGFTAVGLVPAVLHRVAFHLLPISELEWTDYWISRYADFRISSLIFAIPSVLAIAMLYLISRSAGANEAEALLAAFLLAACNSFFMYSQHFLPYDISMLFGLIALWLAIRRRETDVKSGLSIGVLAFCAFWTYNGYFTFVVTLSLLYCVVLPPSISQSIKRFVQITVGMAMVFVPIAAYNVLVLRVDIFGAMLGFAGTITHGAFGEGAVLPFLYFAHAEGGFAVVWIVGLALAIRRYFKSSESDDCNRVFMWTTCILLLYLIMTLFSNALQIFVVYGRVARFLVPFVVMLCAFGFQPLLTRRRLRTVTIFVAAVICLAAANFIPILQIHHYRLVQRYVYSNYEDVSFESTFGPDVPAHGFRSDRVPERRYKLLNAGVFYPITALFDRPPGKVLLEIEHFGKVKALQYEGMSARTREIFNMNDVKIWLIDTRPDEE